MREKDRKMRRRRHRRKKRLKKRQQEAAEQWEAERKKAASKRPARKKPAAKKPAAKKEKPEAEEQPPEEEAPAKKRGMMGGIIWMLIGVAMGGAGFSLPYFMPGLFFAEAQEEKKPTKVDFVEIGDVTVNLHQDNANRFLRVNITAQIDEADKVMVTELVEKRKAIITNWLLSSLSDRGLEEIRGSAGQNRLRREIQDHYNSVLFPDGNDLIQDVLFEEFTVQ